MTEPTERRVAARDGTELLVRDWPAATTEPAWAHVLLVHGLGEHSGRYRHVAEWLTAAGLEVHAYDQRGFGASGGRRAFVEAWSELHDDLEDRLDEVRATAAGVPVVLYGHSLGGLVALGFVLADRTKPDLLVLSAPAIESTIPGWKLALARVLGRVAPRLAIPNGLRGDQLSRDPAVGVDYLADPLNVHRSTAGFGLAGILEQERVLAHLDGLALPTRVVHGAEDTIVPVAASERLIHLKNVERRVVPTLRHETHNEPEGQAVVAETIEWLRRHVNGEDRPPVLR